MYAMNHSKGGSAHPVDVQEERQQLEWQRMMRSRAKECRMYGLTPFLTPALVAQLLDKTSPSRQLEALMVVQLGTRLLKRERELHRQQQAAAASCRPFSENSSRSTMDVDSYDRDNGDDDAASGQTVAAGSWNASASDMDAASGRTMAAGSWSVGMASPSDASNCTMAAGSWSLTGDESTIASVCATESSAEEMMMDVAEQHPVWTDPNAVHNLNVLCQKYGVPIFLTDTTVHQLCNLGALSPRRQGKLLAKVQKGLARLRLQRYRRRYSSIAWDETNTSSSSSSYASREENNNLVGTIVAVEHQDRSPTPVYAECNFLAVGGTVASEADVQSVEDDTTAQVSPPKPCPYHTFRRQGYRFRKNPVLSESYQWVDDEAVLPALFSMLLKPHHQQSGKNSPLPPYLVQDLKHEQKQDPS